MCSAGGAAGVRKVSVCLCSAGGGAGVRKVTVCLCSAGGGVSTGRRNLYHVWTCGAIKIWRLAQLGYPDAWPALKHMG